MKLVAGAVPVVIAYFVQRYAVPFETLQFWIAVATLPAALLFIVAYIPERPWANWFGASLLLLAVGVFSYASSVILFRLYGFDYWGRNVMVVTSIGLVCTAMWMRTVVLLTLQRRDRRLVGSFLARHTSRIYHTFIGR